MATIHKQEFRIRDLSTRSVILFPSRAQVIRDIKEIILEPGANQIVIDGLAPTVDEHSIKVEGTGSATITDVSVDLLPNRDVYEDVYPSSDSEDDDGDDEDEEDEQKEAEAMNAMNDKIKKFDVEILNQQERINSAAKRLMICDNFGKSVADNRPPIDEMGALVKAYQVEREQIYADHEAATAAVDRLRESVSKAEKEKIKLAKALVKEKQKAEKEKAKAKEKKLRRKVEALKEKQRIKEERESFWPKKVYRVTINLEPSTLTPASSRRNSIDGDTIVNLATSDFHESSDTPLKSGEISLSLSYITYSASWAPRYDLSLNTVKCNGILEYGAELKNTTSETWNDARITLSTSQTTFSGLSETIPVLKPWHVRLLKGGRSENSALFSNYELQAKHTEWHTQSGGQQKPREQIFGKDNSSRNTFGAMVQANSLAKKTRLTAQINQMVSQQPTYQSSALFGNGPPPPAAAGFAESSSYNPSFARKSHARNGNTFFGAGDEDKDDDESDEDMGFGCFDATGSKSAPESVNKSLTFEEGAWEESGMTTTYEIPQAKTLAPSVSTVKHKIAKVEFKNIIYSHIVIGKLRQVAFLKARLRNTSKLTLLKGPLGLTLDGSFLGQASFPRCSSGESFILPLGVDPALSITYPKPTVRRSQTGIFNKEDTNIFTRTILLTNTKHNSAAEITVLDQIPVSEDERLRIEITTPKGLKVGGEGVKSGSNGNSGALSQSALTAKDARASVYGGEGSGKWGSAIATAKKGGEVAWNVKLNPGQSVKLVLEYEATYPSGEAIVS